ncbi:hypothetical protein N7493_006034 [Penicillium malachiteum]|uniref:Uncharacterized protein n=1 Tax=Penicillium malachiteum TaxID=1324776 RepID=A0AAD6HLK0_9EURO|nr:hypothetical protein N7493_006034 [Penicillium malachiteum]
MQSPISSTGNLRYHLRGQHGYSVEDGKNGPPNSAEQAAIFEWFEQLMKNQGKKKNGAKRQQKREDEGKDKAKVEDKVEGKEDVKEEDEEDRDEDECY